MVKKEITGKSIPCPKVFNPVCAELLGVKATFINECLVNAENVKFNKSMKMTHAHTHNINTPNQSCYRVNPIYLPF